MKNYYVYILKDQNVPFYIGMGTGNRAYSHESYAIGESELGYGLTKDYNPYKTRKIQKLLRENRKIEYDFFHNLSKEEAYDYEIILIKQYGRKHIDPNGILTNITQGGVGGDCYTGLSDERKEERRNKIKQYWNNLSIEKRQERIEKGKISKRKLSKGTEKGGTSHTSETRKCLSESKKGKNNPMFGKVSPNRGKLATGGNARGVRKAWNKGIKTGERPETIIKKKALKKILEEKKKIGGRGIKNQIGQYDENDNLIKIWESQAQASKSLELSQGSISNAIKSIRGQILCGGFRWKRLSQ